MQIMEQGPEQGRTLLFLPCAAVPVQAFEGTTALLAQKWHIFRVIFEEAPDALPTVEQAVEKIAAYLSARHVSRLDAAYGCGLGGACITRLLALGTLPVGRAIIDGGSTPCQKPFLMGRLLLWRDAMAIKNQDSPGAYHELEPYLRPCSARAVRRLLQLGSCYALPKTPAAIATKITYWYGDAEKKARQRSIHFMKGYFPQVRIHGIPKMAHAELVTAHPEEFCYYADKFLMG